MRRTTCRTLRACTKHGHRAEKPWVPFLQVSFLLVRAWVPKICACQDLFRRVGRCPRQSAYRERCIRLHDASSRNTRTSLVSPAANSMPRCTSRMPRTSFRAASRRSMASSRPWRRQRSSHRCTFRAITRPGCCPAEKSRAARSAPALPPRTAARHARTAAGSIVKHKRTHARALSHTQTSYIVCSFYIPRLIHCVLCVFALRNSHPPAVPSWQCTVLWVEEVKRAKSLRAVH